ncbi:hypothetical protein GGS21DRAFT_486303 [Xylaria nigripes]|nr:hypothetical protein GGS21DRAFT_486303 [Xylaria nigripes]
MDSSSVNSRDSPASMYYADTSFLAVGPAITSLQLYRYSFAIGDAPSSLSFAMDTVPDDFVKESHRSPSHKYSQWWSVARPRQTEASNIVAVNRMEKEEGDLSYKIGEIPYNHYNLLGACDTTERQRSQCRRRKESDDVVNGGNSGPWVRPTSFILEREKSPPTHDLSFPRSSDRDFSKHGIDEYICDNTNDCDDLSTLREES